VCSSDLAAHSGGASAAEMQRAVDVLWQAATWKRTPWLLQERPA